jgi:hypothetical protein
MSTSGALRTSSCACRTSRATLDFARETAAAEDFLSSSSLRIASSMDTAALRTASSPRRRSSRAKVSTSVRFLATISRSASKVRASADSISIRRRARSSSAARSAAWSSSSFFRSASACASFRSRRERASRTVSAGRPSRSAISRARDRPAVPISSRYVGS